MTITRRELLIGGATATVFAACGGATKSPAPSAGSDETATKPAKKRILILGGTSFLGPATIEAALARGHEITTFNRGKREKTRPLEMKVERLYGNRDPLLPADDEKGPDGTLLHPDGSPKGLEQLAGKQWDVVIDNSGFYPRMVKASADLLAPSAKLYIYISSISAYGENPPNGGDETTKLATLADPTVETMGDQFQNYGGLKALCEQAAQAAFGDRACIVRPGYIVGPGDPTDRFTYWPARIAKGGDIAIPGSPSDPLQWIDVRDLGEWLVTLSENLTGGSFSAVGPAQPARWADVVDACVAAAPTAKANLVWVPTAYLEKTKLIEEGAFPIWAPPVGEFAGFHRWKNDRAKATGLRFRPVTDTVSALLAWLPGELEKRARITAELKATAEAKGAPPPKMADPTELRAGPNAAKEAELLAQFRASK
jgi:2'-hydroxyisoflavone reductase